ncbi:putative transcriptional regulator [Streptomyces bingchenggensis BCW-1]|uniref:Putative transcriptional regulator n=1 Tax=Streptomyces bingchenggensis (strain BCW-1) TaxID=749414 RepID=D7BVL7_STRBB|nr:MULTISPECIES: LCP family protein [Streptomyces]ADI07618.1 putative transcriptional regulator [Streptomyces bingchenggensis BCW-1]
MDAQGHGRADDFDPADQWVFDPNTGSYELRLNPAEDSADITPEDRPAPRSRSRRRAEPEPEPPPTPSRGRRRAAGKPEKPTGPTSRRKPKPKKSKAKKALYWTSGTLAFILVGGSVAAYLVYQHLNNNIKKVDVGENNAAVSDGPMNILVIGTDKRDGKGNEGYGDAGSVGHADTTLLFHVSADRTNATALSIPRDMITDVPQCTTRKDGTKKTIDGEDGVRFNTSLGQEGRDPSCTWATVEKITGLEINHFLMADFNAVKTLSSAVGGVEVCLGKDIDDPKSHLKLSKGRHTIEGEQALAFVRTRHSVGFESDLDRIKLQQQFLSSMMRKMKSSGTLTSPSKMWDLANSATKALTVDTGIGTVNKLKDLALNLSKVDLKNVTFVTVPVVDNTDGATVKLDEAKAEPLFAMVRQDVSLTEVKKKEKADKAKEAAKLKGPKADPANVRVKVLNGSGKMGAAQETVDWMQNTEGMLRSSNGGNASANLKKTTLEYAPNQADQARRLADSMGLPGSALKEGTKDAAPMAEMTLTLGADFKGAGTPITAPAKAPKDIQRVEADDKSVCAK